VWACIVGAALMTTVPTLAQSTGLESARALYAAAEYDDALTALDSLRASNPREDVGRIEYYRALCLLAVGKTFEADAAIEMAVNALPFVQPSASETSPRVRAEFRDVRRRVLPALIERRYEDAKAAFDRKDGTAAERFRDVVTLIDDPDIQDVATQPALAQTRALAADYLALCVHRQ
jgi:hypothetical protein